MVDTSAQNTIKHRDKKYFCTFADSRMQKTLDRIKDQAEDLNFFDEILIYDENKLDTKFKKDFQDKLIKGSRGYGYWVWKPQIILQTLEKMNEGDVLLYCDAGCHLNKQGVKRLEEYFKRVKNSDSGLLVFQEGILAEDPELIIGYNNLESTYAKGDIFDFFDVRNKPEIHSTGIIIATTFLIKKNIQSVSIIEQWLNVFKNNFHLVDDSPSKSVNFKNFIENRHDQSIFSILCKINKVATISGFETWQTDWSKLGTYPIWAKRDKKLTPAWFVRQKIRALILRIKKLIKTDTVSQN